MTDWTPDRIRELRTRLGLTSHAQAAEIFGVSRPTWTGFESGDCAPSKPVRILFELYETGKLALEPCRVST